MANMDVVCSECAFCMHYGVGYSEYTITGEIMKCVKEMRPDIDTENESNESVQRQSRFAANCKHFHRGTGLRLGLYIEDINELKEWRDWQKANPEISKDKHVAVIIAKLVYERIDK
jgi:hypothetical protein